MKKISLSELPREGVSHDPQIAKQVLLRRGDVPHLNAFSRAILAPGETTRSHAHRGMFEVFWVDSGTGEMRLAGVAHHLEHGICIVVAPGEPHEITNTGSSDLVLMYFGIEE